MDQTYTSTYRRLQTSVAKWMDNIKMRHMGFDTRICGRTYSVVGIDYKNNTYAVMIYENANQVKRHMAEWLAARGKFSRLLIMVPTREIGYKIHNMIPSDIGFLVETPQWRGAQSWRHGYCASTSKRITNAKIQESIGFRNTNSIKKLVKWIGENPGKKLDDTIIESLQTRNRNSFEQMMLEKQKATQATERFRGLYSFLHYFMDTDIIDKIAAVGSRMSYRPFSYYKIPKNSDNEVEKHGFCAATLKSITKTAKETFNKMNVLCTKCKVNKQGRYYPTMWNDLSISCSGCVHITAQNKLVKEYRKHDRYTERQRIRTSRKLA